MKYQKLIYSTILLSATAALFLPDYNPNEKIKIDINPITKIRISYETPAFDSIKLINEDSMVNLELDSMVKKKGLKNRYFAPIYMLPDELLK